MSYAFTVFTRRMDGIGGTHIGAVEVESYDCQLAAIEGRRQASIAFVVGESELHVVGVAVGYVEVCRWDDDDCASSY